jgi:hypothetical protein
MGDLHAAELVTALDEHARKHTGWFPLCVKGAHANSLPSPYKTRDFVCNGRYTEMCQCQCPCHKETR